MCHGERRDKEVERIFKRLYIIIDDEIIYIDPEIVKKYDLDKQEFNWLYR